jgi:hypothetical protein
VLLIFIAIPARALTINFVYDTDANLTAAGVSDIQAMKNANTYAAKLLTDQFKDNITVNIMVKASPGTNDFGSSSTTFDSVDSYDALRALLTKDATSADDTTTASGAGSIPPGTDPIAGSHMYQLTRSQAKAVGLRPDDGEIDGTFTFGGGQAWTYDPNNRAAAGKSDFIGVALHEYSEIMGRNSIMGDTLGGGIPLYVEYDLFHYTGPGARGLNKGPGRFFSIDNGTTLLKAFNDETANKGDNQDWRSDAQDPPDSFNAFGPPAQQADITAVDLRVMDVIGYDPVSASTTPTPTPSATPTPSGSPTRLANISTRLAVQSGDNVLIGGFIVTGTQPKKVIVRGIGPSLGIAGQLENPTLELRDQASSLIASNDDWKTTQQAEITASGVPPTNDLESAIVATLPANAARYTAILRGVNDAPGIGLVEVFDLGSAADSKLANISTRGLVQTDNNVMIGGFIITGSGTLKVLVRAIGPSLPVTGALADPMLELRDANAALLQANDNWQTDQKAEIEATTVPPSNDLESALVRTMPPGNYTAIVRGANNGVGLALVEVYALQ